MSQNSYSQPKDSFQEIPLQTFDNNASAEPSSYFELRPNSTPRPPRSPFSDSSSYKGYSLDVDSNNSDQIPRRSQLRGVDASHTSDLAGSPSFSFTNSIIDDKEMISLSLEDALGEKGNWLTKKSDPSNRLPDINQDGLGIDFNRPLSQIASNQKDLENNYNSEPVSDLSMPFSPVKRLSYAVKAISNKITSTRTSDIPPVPSRESTPVSVQYSVNSAPGFFDNSYARLSTDDLPQRNPYRATNSSTAYYSPIDPDSSYQGESESIYSRATSYYGYENLPSRLNSTTSIIQRLPKLKPEIRLIGHSFKIFGPENKFRLFLYHTLRKVWVKPLIIFLNIFQTVILTIHNARDIFDSVSDNTSSIQFKAWYSYYVNWCQLAIYIFYTLIVLAKCIAYGFYDDSQRKILERAKKDEDTSEIGVSEPALSRHQNIGLRQRQGTKNVSVVKSFVNLIPSHKKENGDNMIDHADSILITPEYQIAPERAFLRSSWDRVDFIAVISYWISLFMMIAQADTKNEAFIFRLLSALPILHLLDMTSGTSSILQSLKVAAPLLVNVGLFVGFFW